MQRMQRSRGTPAGHEAIGGVQVEDGGVAGHQAGQLVQGVLHAASSYWLVPPPYCCTNGFGNLLSPSLRATGMCASWAQELAPRLTGTDSSATVLAGVRRRALGFRAAKLIVEPSRYFRGVGSLQSKEP